MEEERKAIEQSLAAHREVAVDPDVSATRASTIVEADQVGTAFQLAAPRIDEAIDVLSLTNQMPAFSSYRLLEAGCARDLDTGKVSARLPASDLPQSHFLNSLFLMEEDRWPPRDIAQHVLSTERGELGERYVRAAHWARKAELESNPHQAMLFDWFAAESIWNVKRDDDVIPSIRWSLGFPNGHGARLLTPSTRSALDNDRLHRPWSGHIDDRLQRIRVTRNQTVHNGFRLLDLPATEISGLRSLAHLAARSALRTVELGLYAQIQTTSELVEYLPFLLDGILHETAQHVVERLREAGAMATSA